MARKLTEEERQAFLAEPHIGVLSVASNDSHPPLTVPVWYHYAPGGNITFFTGTQGRQARKIGLLQKAGVLSFLVQKEDFPYKYVSVECSVVKTDQPPSAEQMVTIVRRYLPEEMAQEFAKSELGNPDSKLVLFTIRPDRWLTIDYSDVTLDG
jgi:nitroimidazol reductase NimA-like FMN-containing flavoprotein (pyridoxamine 5'-phosphate oxidase superfamily)